MNPGAFQPASGLRRSACSRLLAFVTLFILFATLVACGGGSTTASSGPASPPNPDFSVYAGSATLDVQQELGQDLNVYLTPLNGFSGTVTLTVQGLPTGVSVYPSDQIQVPISGAVAIPQDVGFTASADAAVGSTTITVMATSGTLTHKANFSLVVQAPSSGPAQTNGPPPGRTRYVRADTVTEYADWPNQNWIVYDSNTGQFLMTDPEGSQVVAFKAATETKVASITVPGAFGIDLTPDQSTAYVGTLIGDVYAIDTATLTVTKRYIASQIGPSGFEAVEALVMADGRLALLGDGQNLSGLAAIDGFGGVAFWDPTTNSLSTYNFPNCASSHTGGFTRSPDRTKLFIGYTEGAAFCEIAESTEQDTFVGTPDMADFSTIAISPDGNYIALPDYPNHIVLYDANTLSFLAQFDVAGIVDSPPAFSADSNTLFVVEDLEGVVYAYNVATQALTGQCMATAKVLHPHLRYHDDRTKLRFYRRANASYLGYRGRFFWLLSRLGFLAVPCYKCVIILRGNTYGNERRSESDSKSPAECRRSGFCI